MQIVERIKAKCKEIGTSMNALEGELGFGNGNIRRWDERTPSADRVLILANRLGVSVDWLLTGKEYGELTADERKLIELYRSTNTQGKGSIINNAEYCAKTMPMEQQLLTSKLG